MKIDMIGKFEHIFNKITKSNQIHEAIFFVENANDDFAWSKGYGGKELDSSMLMASITKLFTTTCVLILQQQGKLSLDDKLGKYFDKLFLSGLHVYRGKEYSFDLTIADLLFQISGLPDIFEEGKDSGKNKALEKDFSFSFDEMVKWTKELKPHFEPRTKGKAYYSDINFDILGRIIEEVNNTNLVKSYEQLIFNPLGLKNTYLPETEKAFVPTIYYKDKPLHMPQFICSCRASGGCVTTARELMIFLKSFWRGKLFDKTVFRNLSHNNRLQISMYPIRYAGGYMQVNFGLPFGVKGELLGHSGSTGSFAFYCPKSELFFVGDMNQFANPALPIRAAMQLGMVANKFNYNTCVNKIK